MTNVAEVGAGGLQRRLDALEDANKALELSEAGHARGKIIVKVRA